MTVFLVRASAEVPLDEPGPWTELRAAGEGLVLVDSDQTLSRVYHALSWSLPEGAALVVAPLAVRPKLKGLAPGTTTWLRDRLPAP